MSLELEGLDSTLSRLSNAIDKQKLNEILQEACLLVERSAKQKAPKGRTGELRRSIASRVEGEEGVVYTPLEYAPYVEFGTGLFAEEGGRTDVPWSYKDEKDEWHTTSGMPPQPYMRPALDENREEIIKLFREGIFNG